MIEIISRAVFRAATLPALVGLCLVVFAAPANVTAAETRTLTVNGSGTLLGSVTVAENLPSPTGALTMASLDSFTPPASVPSATSSGISSPAIAASSVEFNAGAQVVSASWANAESSRGTLLGPHELSTDGTDVTPVPEASTWLTALLAAGAILYLQRHRFLRPNDPQQTS